VDGSGGRCDDVVERGIGVEERLVQLDGEDRAHWNWRVFGTVS
jgi:hypothetical protein